MDPLQIQLCSDGRPALIAGGGPAAVAAIDALRRAGIAVTLIAPRLCNGLKRQFEAGDLCWRAREFTAKDVAEARLVFAADANAEHSRTVRDAAAAYDRLFCDLTTGRGDFCLAAPATAAAERDDPWQHTQVCLVGAGPGDPGLLTLDGERALRGADVVLYDRLVSSCLLDYAPAGAERIFVGKQRNHHEYRQPQLNALMIELARAGRRVLRLKGGDPFLFGRGGEELVELSAAGVATRVIPGITAGSGCATYADIPLTHRDYADSCQFITAHGKNGQKQHDWGALVRSRHTLVVYMGLMALRDLCPKLIEHGLDAETPAALIERGTTPEQRVLTGTVLSLPVIASQHTVRSPAVLIVGAVVALRETIRAVRTSALV